MDQYTYSPLGPSQLTFRLLTINPLSLQSDLENMLDCSLRNAEVWPGLDLHHETVSYCWGDPSPSKLTQVDGKSLPVPANTERTLRRIRLQDRPRTVWIDAVCINQADTTEQSRQVEQMGRIYALAKSNLIELGDGKDSAIVLRSINNIKAIAAEIREQTDDFRRLRDLMLVDDVYVHADSHIQTTIDVDALIDIYSNPWFRRIWVVQEAVLARHNKCRYGDYDVDFSNVLTVAAWLYHHHAQHIPRSLYDIPGLQNAAMIWEMRTSRDPRFNKSFALEKVNITFALCNSIGLECLRPHDKVYGMLGIATDPSRSIPKLLKPDYNRPISQVFRDATRYSIQTQSHLYILRYVSHRNQQDVSFDGFSSWVPRFDRWQDSGPTVLPLGYRTPTGIWHSGDQTLGVAVSDDELLTLRGLQVGDIKHVSAVFLDEDSTRFWHHTLEFLDANHSAYKLRLARLLTAGVDHHQCLASDTYYEIFDHWLAHFQRESGTKLPSISELPMDAEESLKKAVRFHQALTVINPRRWALTTSGLMALVPRITKSGDIIACFEAGNTPYAFRPMESGEYQFLGEVYLEDHMDGEVLKKARTAGKVNMIFNIR